MLEKSLTEFEFFFLALHCLRTTQTINTSATNTPKMMALGVIRSLCLILSEGNAVSVGLAC